jgi:hypothetical protein
MAGPGRPRKEPVDKEVNLSHSALSICKNSNNEWVVVKIKYDPITRIVGEIEEDIQTNKAFAINKFKILVAHEIFGGKE